MLGNAAIDSTVAPDVDQLGADCSALSRRWGALGQTKPTNALGD